MLLLVGDAGVGPVVAVVGVVLQRGGGCSATCKYVDAMSMFIV